MAAAAEGATLHLAVLAQGTTLAVSLTDLRLLARLEISPLTADALAALQRETETALAALTGMPAQAVDEAALRTLGTWLMQQLLPPGIAQVLRDAPDGPLCLQVDPQLDWVPWELLWDGAGCLGERFRIVRRIVDPAAGALPAPRHNAHRGTLKVLLITSGTHDHEPPAATRLMGALRSMAGITVSAAHAGDLPRDELLPLIGAADIAHYIGPVDGRPSAAGAALWWAGGEPLDLALLAALPATPPLLISQGAPAAPGDNAAAHRAIARSACRLGLNLLTCEATPSGDPQDDMVELYAALLRGAAAGEAAWWARTALHRAAGIGALAAWRPELYGDGTVVMRERRTAVDDNLRQVTIVSIDLVESTRLLAQLGAERYSDKLALYHRHCTDILQAHGGVPDEFQGDDGAMCYFGMPVAREDAAAQALRAALQLVETVQGLGLGVRVGVCTGEVVVRDGQPVGAAIHLAARLQSIAAPGTVVVGESTRRIARERFRFQPLDHVLPLKGFDGPRNCYRLLGEALPPASGPREQPVLQPSLTPFVGRHAELQMLEEHWSAVRGGSLRVVRLLGEAGIGKSRLVREFKQGLLDAGHEVFESRCAPEHANSPFYPLIEALRHEVRLRVDDPAEKVLQRLRALAARAGEVDDGALALLAELLSLTVPIRHPVLEHSAMKRRQLTLELLLALALRRLRDVPGCMIVEDVHWLDPSTAELLDMLAGATRNAPLMILVTARPDSALRWRPRCAVHEAELQGLSPELARAMVQSASGERRLPGDIVQSIARRTDGIPLFIEESTRMVVDLSAERSGLDAAAMPVPDTLLDLLTARLDRLGAAKQIAQVGGTIGREFPLSLLQAVLQHPASPIGAHDASAPLDTLVRAGMLLARSSDDAPRFVFRHALMRDAAYRSLLERDRLRLHQVIAGVLTERFGELAQREPELLASHYTEARMDVEALRCWEAAIRQAASRSAHAEAIGHIHNALAVLLRRPADEERHRQELRLQLSLAARLIATHGYGAERVERAYARAMELARTLVDTKSQLRVELGLEGFHFMRADFEKARQHVLAAAAHAEAGSTTAGAIQRVQTQWALANIRMHQGELAQAVQEMDACRAAAQQIAHHPEAVQDPGVMCLCYSAWSLWELGQPDEARARAMAVVAHAEELRHAFSIGEAFGFRAAVLHFRGENAEALEAADRAVRICEDGGFAVWLAHARVMRGRIAAALGDAAAGVEEMRQGYELWADSGAVVTTPFYLTMRAEGLALDDRPDDALALLAQALAIVERTGERYWEAEIRRLTGVLTLQTAQRAGLQRSSEAERWMLQAMEVAQARQLASLSLRAASSLAELWQQEGQGPRAQATLAACLADIRGGAGTHDVVRAQAQLDRLGRWDRLAEPAPLPGPTG